jgi:hypothetical protein
MTGTAQGHTKNTLTFTLTITIMTTMKTDEQVCRSGCHSLDAPFQSQLGH